jgi:hypothetical protein
MSFFSILGGRVQVDAENQYNAFMSRAKSVRKDYAKNVDKHGYLGAITNLKKPNKEALKTAAFALGCFTSFCFFSPYVTFGLAAAAGYLQPEKVTDLKNDLVKEFETLQNAYKGYKEAKKAVEAEGDLQGQEGQVEQRRKAQQVEKDNTDRNHLLVSGVYFGAKVVAVAASAIFKFGQTVAVGSGLALGVGLAFGQQKVAEMMPKSGAQGAKK